MTVENVKNRIILVTGAAKRIGRAIALRLVKEGAIVAIHYHSSEAEAHQTAQECGGFVPVLQANLENVSEIESLFNQLVKMYGRIDGLVNSAARYTRIDPLEVTEADWDFVHSVNLKAAFFCCQQAALHMRRNPGGGRIVNISDIGSMRPWTHYAHYCASKAGVNMLTRALAKAFAPQITVNAVAPGVIPFGEEQEQRVQRLIAATPARRAGTPDEIASAVLYFLSASNYVTGQILAIDGGLSQR